MKEVKTKIWGHTWESNWKPFPTSLLLESFEKTPQNEVEGKAAVKTFLFFPVIFFIISSLFIVL